MISLFLIWVFFSIRGDGGRPFFRYNGITGWRYNDLFYVNDNDDVNDVGKP